MNIKLNKQNHLTDYQLSIAADALINGEYDSLDKKISNHIEICLKCEIETIELVEVLKQMDESEKEEFNSNNEKRSFSQLRFLKWVAAASVIFFISVSFFYFKQLKKLESEILVLESNISIKDKSQFFLDKDSLEKREQAFNTIISKYDDSLNDLSESLKSKSNLLAESYKEYVLFENQLELNLRSTNIKSSKYIEISYGDSKKLQWKSKSNSTFSIAIYNNKGTLVLREIGLKNSYVFNTNSVLPGVFYWKLLNNEEVVFLGKMSIK